MTLLLEWLLVMLLICCSMTSSRGKSDKIDIFPAANLTKSRLDAFLDCAKNVFWLHTPKTASTFCLTLQHLCCPYYFYTLTRDITLNMLQDQLLLEDKRQQNLTYVVGNGCFSLKRRDYPKNQIHSSRSADVRNLQQQGKAVVDTILYDVKQDEHVIPAPQRSMDAYSCSVGSLGNHLPLTNKVREKNMTMLMMLRDPKMRLISSFLDSIHHEGKSW